MNESRNGFDSMLSIKISIDQIGTDFFKTGMDKMLKKCIQIQDTTYQMQDPVSRTQYTFLK